MYAGVAGSNPVSFSTAVRRYRAVQFFTQQLPSENLSNIGKIGLLAPDRESNFDKMEGHAHNFVDLTGQRFGRLVVADYAGNTDDRLSIWICRCDCGEVFTALGSNLKRGATKSCGCLRRDIMLGNQRNRKKTQ